MSIFLGRLLPGYSLKWAAEACTSDCWGRCGGCFALTLHGVFAIKLFNAIRWLERAACKEQGGVIVARSVR